MHYRLVLIFILVIQASIAQVALPSMVAPTTMPQLIPFRTGDLWGYSDINGKIMVSPKFHKTDFFYGKIAVVEILDSVNFEQKRTFTHTGLITSNGDLFDEFENLGVYTITDTSVMVNTYSQRYIIDIHKNKTSLSQYKEVSYTKNYGIAQSQNNKNYLLDGNGKICREINMDSIEYIEIYDSLLKKKIFPFNSGFINGFKHIKSDSNQEQFMDEKGIIYTCLNPVYPPNYNRWNQSPSIIKNGVAILYQDNKPGVFDSLGNLIIPFGRYDKIDEFSDGMAKAYILDENGEYNEFDYFVSTSGAELKLKPEQTNPDDFHNGFARVEMGKKFGSIGFIKKTGKTIKVKKIYDEVGYFSEGLCWVKLDDNFGFIDTLGKEVIPSLLQYDEVAPFSEGLCRVRKENMYGFIDKKGKEVIPLTLLEVASFHNGFAELSLSKSEYDKIELINKSGMKLPFRFEEGQGWISGFRIIHANDKQGVMDQLNNVIVSTDYDYIKIYNFGLAQVIKNDQWGYINLLNGINYFSE